MEWFSLSQEKFVAWLHLSQTSCSNWNAADRFLFFAMMFLSCLEFSDNRSLDPAMRTAADQPFRLVG